jgi:catechol 2,3-dioxygenase-like lactoylglutathione lyase family enzyme
MKRLLLFFGLLATPAHAASPVDDGWQEAVVSVGDLDDRVLFFQTVIGWELVERATVSRSQLAGWGLPAGATAESALVRAPGASRGYLRLVAFSGVPEASRVRSSARPWDAGGWGGLNVRVRSIDEVFARLQRAGWHGLSDPVTFKVPPYTVREVMVTGPDGLALSLIERVDPPLVPDWSSLWSRAVTVFEADAEPAASDAFYGGRLGLKARLRYDGPAAEPGMNLFGLPHDVAGRAERRVQWWQEQGGSEGTIATLAFRGITGRRFLAHELAPPRLGLFLIAMPVSDAASRCARAMAGGIPPVQTTRVVDRAGTGRSTSCIIRSPSGSWMELYSPRTRSASPVAIPMSAVDRSGHSPGGRARHDGGEGTGEAGYRG